MAWLAPTNGQLAGGLQDGLAADASAPWNVAASPAPSADVYETCASDSLSARLLQVASVLLVGVADVAAAAIALTLVLNVWSPVPGAWRLELCAPAIVLVCKFVGLLDAGDLRMSRSVLSELPRIVEAASIFVLGIMLAAMMLLPWHPGWSIVTLWASLIVGMVIGRGTVRTIAMRCLPAMRCLVITNAPDSDRIRDRLEASGANLTVLAALELTEEDVYELRDTTTVREVVDDLAADHIVLGLADGARSADLIQMAKAAGVTVSVVPEGFALIGSSTRIGDMNGLAVVDVESFRLSPLARCAKRAFDLVLTSVGVLLIAPLLALIALAVKLDSQGPVFFLQTRAGRDGRPFRIIKFRSMVADADAQKEALRGLADVGGLFKLGDDPRVTRVGRMLRRASLDELPQVFNVLRGDMSLVGPRPLVADEDATIVGIDRSRLALRPGITGQWQVLRTRASRDEMVKIDYRYVAYWSLWLDVQILADTVAHVLRARNV